MLGIYKISKKKLKKILHWDNTRECENLLYFKYAGSRFKRACLDSDDTTKRTRTCDYIIAQKKNIFKRREKNSAILLFDKKHIISYNFIWKSDSRRSHL